MERVSNIIKKTFPIDSFKPKQKLENMDREDNKKIVINIQTKKHFVFTS